MLSPDLSHNCLGRAYLLAELLDKNYDVEIVGPTLGDGIWSPVADEYQYKSFDMNPLMTNYPFKYPHISSLISGDVVYASKPRMTSFGFGLLHSISQNKPLILDIDDWESGFKFGGFGSPYTSYIKSIPHMIHVNSLNYMRILELLASKADQITVSNEFLQEKFGGEIIPHVRDTDSFDPALYDTQAARLELGIPTGKHVVLFSGTPRPHKGVDDLIEAVNRINRDDLIVLIVGADDNDYSQKLRSVAGDNVIFKSKQPFDTIPQWIAASDIISIPQRNNPSTTGQLPAKLFDAMAMGKPIVSTNVSDIPTILGDSGVIVEPDSPLDLANAIEELLLNPSRMETLGKAARKRCIQNYSYEVAAPKLHAILLELTCD